MITFCVTTVNVDDHQSSQIYHKSITIHPGDPTSLEKRPKFLSREHGVLFYYFIYNIYIINIIIFQCRYIPIMKYKYNET
jgi:hypothetical protein